MASIKSSRACLHSEVRRVVQRSVKYNFFLLAAPRLRFISDELPGKSKQIKICQKHAACGAGQRAPAEQNAGVWLPNFAPAFFFFSSGWDFWLSTIPRTGIKEDRLLPSVFVTELRCIQSHDATLTWRVEENLFGIRLYSLKNNLLCWIPIPWLLRSSVEISWPAKNNLFICHNKCSHIPFYTCIQSHQKHISGSKYFYCMLYGRAAEKMFKGKQHVV